MSADPMIWRTAISACVAAVTLVAGIARDTVAQSPSPSSFELAVLEETNRARTDPVAFAAHLEQRLPWFDGRVMRRPGSNIGLRTHEGSRAVLEAIAFLRIQAPLSPLSWSDGLWRAARDHALDQGRTGATGHDGGDGSTMGTRISRYGRWLQTAAENIEYGSDDAREVVISLIVDDGVPNRGHRTNIFSPSIRLMGAACGTHPQYRRMCVIDYAGGFEAK